MLRNVEGVGRVRGRLRTAVRVRREGIDGTKRPVVSEDEKGVGRRGANGIRRRAAGAFSRGTAGCLAPNGRLGDVAREEQSLSIRAPLGGLGPVWRIGQPIRNASVERNHEHLRRAVYGADEGEVCAVGVPGGLADVVFVLEQQARIVPSARPGHVQPGTRRGDLAGREATHRVGHGPPAGGQGDLRHLPHPVQVPGLDGPLLVRGDLCRCRRGKEKAREEAHQKDRDGRAADARGIR